MEQGQPVPQITPQGSYYCLWTFYTRLSDWWVCGNFDLPVKNIQLNWIRHAIVHRKGLGCCE